MALHSRVNRINEEIRTAVASILMTELKDPRLKHGLVTVTQVNTTNDLQQTTVWVSVLGSEEDQNEVLEGLQHSRGYIKRLLGERIVIKYLPDLHFRLDTSGAYADHINRLLKQIEKDNPLPDTDEKTKPDNAAK